MPANYRLWAKMIAGGALVSVGGPALVMYLQPTDEELFKRYNPDLQKRALETRDQRAQEYDDFVTKLKQDSKSNKSIWVVQKETEERERKARAATAMKVKTGDYDLEEQKRQMREEAGLPPRS